MTLSDARFQGSRSHEGVPGAGPRPWALRRLTCWAGAAGAMVLTVALSALGDTPDPHDSPEQMTAYFVANRTDVAVSVALFGVALAFLVVFLGAVAGRLHAVGRSASAAAVGISGGGVLLLLALDEVILETLAFRVALDAPGSVKPLFLITIATVPIVGPVVTVLLGTVALAAWPSRLVPHWWSIISAVGAGLAALSAVSFADAGFFYPDTQQQIVYTVLTLWLIGTGLLLGTRQKLPVEGSQTGPEH